MPEQLGDPRETVERVRREMIIDVTGERTSASGLRRVVTRPRKRIDPDEPIRRALQASCLELQAPRVAALPAVGDEQHDRTAAEDTSRPFPVEFVQRVGDARSARPVGHAARDARERGVRAALAQLPRDAREPRSEGECLDATPTARQRMGPTGLATTRTARGTSGLIRAGT